MKRVIYGRKVGMSQFMNDEGVVTPVTLIKCDPLTIIKKLNNNGVESLLVGIEEVSDKKLNKPKLGLFKKNNTKSFKKIKEYRLDEIGDYDSNSQISIDDFEGVEKVTVRTKSIGRGFSGTIKRHNFGRGPMTHGSKNHRLPGSIGGGTDPGRVFKGTRMGGRKGNSNVTIKNLSVVKIDKDNGLIFIKGSVPGKKNNLVEIFS